MKASLIKRTLKPFPKFKSMYINKSEGGSLIERRHLRKGYTFTVPSTYTREWKIENIRSGTISIPGITMPMTQWTYVVSGKTFVPLELLGPVYRYEGICDWLTTYQEVIRHLAAAGLFTTTQTWKTYISMITAYKDEIIDAFLSYVKLIEKHGFFTKAQLIIFAKKKVTTSPFGMKWKDLIDDDKKLSIAWTYIDNGLRDLFREVKSVCDKGLMISAKHTYPGNRPRPALEEKEEPVERVILSKDHKTFKVLIKKWKNRKVGGVDIWSLLEYPIYNQKKQKMLCYEPIWKLMKQIAPSNDLHILAKEGLNSFKFILDHDDGFCSDIKVSEKQLGLGIGEFLPLSVDLGHMSYEEKFAKEFYSGVGPTGPFTGLNTCFLAKAACEVEGIDNLGYLVIFRDNIYSQLKLLDSSKLHIDQSDRFAGFRPKMRSFGPISLATDSPRQRRNPPHSYLPIVCKQSYQYFVRPLMSFVMNNIFSPRSAEKLINWSLDKDKVKGLEYLGKDSFLELMEKTSELHEKFQDEFTDELSRIKVYIPMQFHDPNNVSDLKIY